MTRLNVQATVRWANSVPGPPAEDFQNAPMLLAVSVTDGDGTKVDLRQDQLRVGYQYRPEASEDSLAVISDFHGNGPSFGETRWSSCLVQHQPSDTWGADEVVLFVTVRKPSASGSGFDKGQAMILAKYRQRVAELISSLDTAVERTSNDVAQLANKVDDVHAALMAFAKMAGKLSSGVTAVGALAQILATVEEIKKEV